MIDGHPVKMGGKDYTVPALSFKQLRQLQPAIALIGNIGSVPTDEQMSAVVDIVHAALSRNYPELDKDGVEDQLDLSNIRPVLEAVMGAAGLTKGEAKAGNL